MSFDSLGAGASVSTRLDKAAARLLSLRLADERAAVTMTIILTSDALFIDYDNHMARARY